MKTDNEICVEAAIANSKRDTFELSKAGVNKENARLVLPQIFGRLSSGAIHNMLLKSSDVMSLLDEDDWRHIFNKATPIVEYYLVVFFLVFTKIEKSFLMEVGVDGRKYSDLFDQDVQCDNDQSNSRIYKTLGLTKEEIGLISNYGRRRSFASRQGRN